MSLQRAQESAFWCACNGKVDKKPRYFIHDDMDKAVLIGFGVNGRENS